VLMTCWWEGLDDEVLTAGVTTWKYSGHFWIGYGGHTPHPKVTLCEEYSAPWTALAFRARCSSNRPRPAAGWHISQDNERGITARELDQQCDRRRYRLRPYAMPAASGDLRCIEGLWKSIRLQLYKGGPGALGDSGPENRRGDSAS